MVESGFHHSKKLSVAMAALVCIMLATNANAQSSAAPPMTQAAPMELRNNQAAIETMRPDRDTVQSFEIYNHTLNFAACAARQSIGLVNDVLATSPGSTSEDVQLGRMKSHFGGCNPQQVVGILSLERGALSEAAYKAMTGEAYDESAITATGQDSTDFLAAEQKWNKVRVKSDRGMIDATNCLVAVQPGLAHKLLFTRHGSHEEAVAFEALFKSAPTCAGEKRPANLSSSFLRAFVADSLYRLAQSEWSEKFLPWVRKPA